MALLGTYLDVATVSLGGASTVCVAHSLPSRPDFAAYQSTSTFGGAVALLSRGNTAVVWYNSGGSSTPGEQLLMFVHSLIR